MPTRLVGAADNLFNRDSDEAIGAGCRSRIGVAGWRRLFRSGFGLLGLCCFGKRASRPYPIAIYSFNFHCLSSPHLPTHSRPATNPKDYARAVALLHFAYKSEIGQRPRDRDHTSSLASRLGACQTQLRGTTVR